MQHRQQRRIWFAEAEQHFQADMADIYFDFYQLPLATSTEVDTEKTVILVGAKREMIETEKI